MNEISISMITEYFIPINFSIDGPDIGLMLLFKDVTPNYLKEHFLKWCCMAVAEIDPSRERAKDAIRYAQTEFVGLINAFHATAAVQSSGGHKKVFEEVLDSYFSEYYKPDAKERDILIPTAFFKAFFKGIAPDSMKSILWLMVHVITANKEKYQYELTQAQVLNLFERFTGIVSLSNDLKKDLDKPNASKKKSATNLTKKKKKRRK